MHRPFDAERRRHFAAAPGAYRGARRVEYLGGDPILTLPTISTRAYTLQGSSGVFMLFRNNKYVNTLWSRSSEKNRVISDPT